MVDVADLREYCRFGEDRVYLLLVIARSKENDEESADAPVIRKVVRDAESLECRAAELDHAVRRFDATYRLYLTANARNTLDAFFQFRRDTEDWIEMRLRGDEGVARKFDRMGSEWTSVLQSDRCRDETNFVFDCDDATAAEAAALAERLADRTTVLLERETPNGHHLVTEPFDYTDFETDVGYELKTDGLVFVSYVGADRP